jgi:hypothetical protein
MIVVKLAGIRDIWIGITKYVNHVFIHIHFISLDMDMDFVIFVKIIIVKLVVLIEHAILAMKVLFYHTIL